MLLDETEAPMDFSRGSELTEFEGRPVEMDHLNTRKSPAPEKGLDLSNSVLDRLSQKVMRSGSQKLHISLLVTFFPGTTFEYQSYHLVLLTQN